MSCNNKTSLKDQFMEIVKQMIDNGDDLPEDFMLFYTLRITSDRQGKTIKIDPHLTRTQAENNKGNDEEWEGKYGTTVEYSVVTYETKVCTENIYNDCDRKTQAISMI